MYVQLTENSNGLWKI